MVPMLAEAARQIADPQAVWLTHGKGPKMYDVDGTEYVDLVCSWGPLILGHAHAEILDATFHDGTPVNAEAVRWSLERARALPKSTVASELTSIVDVQAPDANTVVLTLNRPAADLIYRLSTLAGAIVNPAAANADLSMTEAGSGPYVLDELKVGDRVCALVAGGGYAERCTAPIMNLAAIWPSSMPNRLGPL